MTLLAVALLTVLGSHIAVAADRTIEMRDIAFAPGRVEIRVGDRVTWTNRDGVEHNATNGSFDTGLLASGESASIRFTAPGTYAFHCTPHPSMTGTVVVRSVAAPATDTADPAASGMGPPDGPWLLLGGVFLVAIRVASMRMPDRRPRA